MTDLLHQLDDLITSYNQDGHAGRRIAVKVTPTKLRRLLGKMPRADGREFDYRGHIVIATATDPVAARFMGGT